MCQIDIYIYSLRGCNAPAVSSTWIQNIGDDTEKKRCVYI